MTSLTLSFNDVNFSPVQQDGQIWLTASELAKALGYAKSDAISQVYERNQDEFNSSMTTIISVKSNESVETLNLSASKKTRNLVKTVRIFSLRGCHLIAMFSKTVIAKQFRKWVLDVLDKEVANPQSTKNDRVPLKNAVNMLVAKSKFLNYSDAYALVHHRFNIKHLDELTIDQLPKAIEYVHQLIGEYIPKVEHIDPELKAFELLASDTTNKINNWIWSLQAEIERLKGNIPSYPEFDREAITRAVVSRMASMSRMLLTIDIATNKPQVQFIPNNSWILDDESIAKIIGDREGPKKEVLPDIVQAAMKRLIK
ncbi:Bro-N domain-containing protein [Acinetobacter guillouiae]|uniref:BRO-N domain-containing protein n=1 Tax=Acinetobacter guillouiae TaxID=106649 RepID=UPI00300ADAA5